LDIFLKIFTSKRVGVSILVRVTVGVSILVRVPVGVSITVRVTVGVRWVSIRVRVRNATHLIR